MKRDGKPVSGIVRTMLRLLTLLALPILLLPGPAPADDKAAAEQAFQSGLALQKDRKTPDAIDAYRRAIKLDPSHPRAHYELGWSYWVLGDWDKVIAHWEQAQRLGADARDLPDFLARARRYQGGKEPPLVHPDPGLEATGTLADGRQLAIRLQARFQHYNPETHLANDHFDPYVFSPKSVRLHPDGRRAYVNALEGYSTLIFDPVSLGRTGRILHRFREQHTALFSAPAGTPWGQYHDMPADRTPDQFTGKPVESALSHDGRYLWVPYYRKDFDQYASMPSAVAVIDTRTDRIVRVLDTGPIPKYVVASPDDRWLAVIHWGNNTVGLIDISSGNPQQFRRAALLTIGRRIDTSKIDTRDRDHGCGYCLRGAVFTADGKHLLVARMGGNGGIAVIDVDQQRYRGAVHGMRPTPRHLALSTNGQRLYVSSSFAGYVAVFSTQAIVDAAYRKQRTVPPLAETKTGPGTRTISLSPDGELVYAAVNQASKLVVLEAGNLREITRIDADSFPVGLDVSADGRQVWLTSQGRKLRGGNAVDVFSVEISNKN